MYKSLLLLFSVHLTTLGAVTLCDEGGHSFNGRCYYARYGLYRKSILHYWGNCGGDHDIWPYWPTSAKENKFVKKFVAKGPVKGFWGAQSPFVKSPATLGYEISYWFGANDWMKNKTSKGCMYMDVASGGKWEEASCGDLDMGFICKAAPLRTKCVGDVCFFIETKIKRVNKIQAEEKCKRMGGKLAKIDTAEKQDIVSKFLADQPGEYWTEEGYFWISATDEAQEGHWVWPNGDPVGDYAWQDGEPNNSGGDEDCAIMDSSHGFNWIDINCEKIYSALCEIERSEGLIG